jgi:hypothetical protein
VISSRYELKKRIFKKNLFCEGHSTSNIDCKKGRSERINGPTCGGFPMDEDEEAVGLVDPPVEAAADDEGGGGGGAAGAGEEEV